MQKFIIVLLVSVLFSFCSKKSTEIAVTSPKEQSQEFRKNSPKAGPAPKINISKAETFLLENGLQVIVVENHKVPQVSFQVSLKNDPIIEGDKVGYVSMAGQILNRGTNTKTKAEIDESVDFLGASLSTSSGGIFASSLTKHSAKLLDIMTDVLYNPSFPQEELDKIKKQSLSGLESIKSSPDDIAGNVRSRVLYGTDHPYGEVQTIGHVNNISLDDLKAYYERFFIPNNAYLVVVGDISKEKAKAIAEKYFGKWQKKAFKPVKNKEVSLPQDRQVHFANKDGAVQSIINIAYPLNLYPGTADVIKVSVMNSILGGGFSSRLMQNLREDKAYTYSASSSVSSDELIGRFVASASVRNEVTDSSITELLYEMDRIVKNPVEEIELQSIKNYMTGGFARSLESPQTIARFAINTFKFKLPADYYETYLEKLNAVTVADVSAMAAKYITPNKAQIIVTGNKDEVAKKLLSFDTNGQIDYYSPFAEKMDYNATALPEGVNANSVISDYINAIGGQAKISGINTMYIKMNADLMGQAIITESYQMKPNKFAMKVGNGQMVFQEQVFDGEKALTSSMGQKSIVTEGDAYNELMENAPIIPQQYYGKGENKIELKGIEDVNGKKCYKLAVTSANGKLTTEYYDMGSSLLVQSVTSAKGPQGALTITSEFSDYKEVSGILYPYLVKVAGMMPVTVEMKVETLEINGKIDPTRFEIK